MLDSNLIVLEKTLEEIGAGFREIALDVDTNPSKIYEYVDREDIKILSRLVIPKQFNDHPLVINGQKFYGISILERVIALEKLAYGDVGVVLASPGPSLSGQVVLDMGSEQQQENYYSRFFRENTWTFFALTEPQKGSDASNLESSLTKQSNNYLLNGEKKFIGNGKRAQVGVVFARTNPGPLGIRCVLVDTNKSGFYGEKLNTLGLKAAELSYLKFDNLCLDSCDILGEYLSPIKSGLWGAIQTFNKMRPGVAALALGVAQATMDFIYQERKIFSSIEDYYLNKFKDELISVRNLIRYAAKEVDHNPTKGYTASMAKVKAVKLVERITEYAVWVFGANSLIDYPLLNKWYRDARAFEFMEGTTNIQNLNIYQNYLSGKIYNV